MIRQFNGYKISDQQYVELIYKQKNSCAICGCKGNGITLNIDHDHQTGEIRGLLCKNCNVGLGMFKDSIPSLMSAITYLQNHASKI